MIIDVNNKFDITIRSMQSQDIEHVYAIEKAIFTDAWPLVAFKECLMFNENYILYSNDNEEVLGYLIGIGIEDEYSIYNIAIKESHQRQGLASYLLKTVINIHDKKYEFYYLEVRKSNVKARAFYDSFNFVESYTRRNYYSNPVEDALVLKLRIHKHE